MLLVTLGGCGDDEPNVSPAEAEPGEINTGSEIVTMDGMPAGLVVVNYELDNAQKVITGSVMNNSNMPYVNVQVGFDLYDESGTLLGTASDATSEVGPGGTWQFSALVPPNVPVTRAEIGAVQATLKQVVGSQADPAYPQNDPGRVGSPTEFNRINPGSERDLPAYPQGQGGNR